MNIWGWFLGVSVMMLGIPILAAQATQGPAKSLEECYIAALHQSELVASQGELITQAEERIRQSYGGMLPTIAGVGSSYYQDPISSSIYPSVQNTVKLTANQPLFVGLRDFATLRQSKDLKLASVKDRQAAEVQLYKDTAQAFYTLLSLERDYDNVQTELGLNTKRVGELRGRIRIGRSRLSEVLTIQSAAASLSAQADQLNGQIAAARDVLAFQTGLARDVALKDDAPVAPVKVPDLERFLSRLESRPDVLGNKSRVSSFEEGVSIAKGGHLPTLGVTGDYYFLRPGLLADSKWDVQLTLSLPIYAGGTIQSQVRTQSSLLKQSELTLDRARRLGDEEIRSLHHTVLSDEAQMVSLDQATKLSERNYSEETREYRLGLVTNIEVLQALTTFQESRRALDRVRYTLKNDLEHLEAAAALKPENLTQAED